MKQENLYHKGDYTMKQENLYHRDDYSMKQENLYHRGNYSMKQENLYNISCSVYLHVDQLLVKRSVFFLPTGKKNNITLT